MDNEDAEINKAYAEFNQTLMNYMIGGGSEQALSDAMFKFEVALAEFRKTRASAKQRILGLDFPIELPKQPKG